MAVAGNEDQLRFPQFRKYKNGKSYFKVHSMSSFDEIKWLPGDHYQLYRFKARILPDRNFVSDMLFDYEKYWDVINEEDYREMEGKVSTQ